MRNGKGGVALYLPYFTVTAAFVIGAGLLAVGKSGTDLMTVVFAALIAIPVVSIAAAGAHGLTSIDEAGSSRGKVALALLAAVISTAAIYVGAMTLKDGTEFTRYAVIPEANGIFTAAVILAVAAYMALSGRRAIKKFALAALVFAFISSVALIISPLLGGNIAEAMSKIEMPDAESVLICLSEIFLPCAVGIIWTSIREKRGSIGGAQIYCMVGLGLGTAVLLICYLTVALTLGLTYAATRIYPYLDSVGSMTVGKLFMRPEGVVYMSFFATLWLRLSVCLSLVGSFAPKRHRRWITLSAAVLVFAIYLFLS